MVWPMSGPSVTVATSRIWVVPPMTMFSNSSGVVTSAVVRTIRSWLVVVIEPAGLSKATEASALRRSATVKPWLASLLWSTSMRKIFSRSP